MFPAANKKNNRRYSNRGGRGSYNRQRKGNSFNSFSSNSYPNQGNLNMVPPTGRGQFDVGSNFQDQTVLLHGSNSEELKSWLNSTLTPILRRRGAMDLIDQPGKPSRGPPDDAMYATNVGSAKEKLQEVRKKADDVQKFNPFRGETYTEVVAYNHVSTLIEADVQGDKLNQMIKVLNSDERRRWRAQH